MSYNVIAKAHFPHIKPAHYAFISKQGEGSNLDRAVRDAVANIFKDERLKGMRADNIMPATIKIALFAAVQEEDGEEASA
jgi:hypothetical protein